MKDIFSFFFLVVVMVIQTEFQYYTLYTIYIDLIVFQIDIPELCLYIKSLLQENQQSCESSETRGEGCAASIVGTYHKQRNPILLMELKALKKQHLIISSTVQILNLIFILLLLASVIITFYEITFTLYLYALR